MIMHGHIIIESWICYPQVYTYTVECGVTDANYCLWANFNCACQTLHLLDNNFNPLRTVITYMHQANKYFTVHKQIIIISPPFTL